MRTKKTFLNIIILALYQLVATGCSFLIPRMMLSTFGSEYNGIVASATQFFSFISILQAGVSGSTIFFLYKSLADNDILRTSRYLKATQSYIRKNAFFFLIFLLVLSCVFKFIAKTDVSWQESFILIMITGIATFAQYYFGMTYHFLLKADQRAYIYNFLQIITVVLNALFVWLLIKVGMNIFVVKLASSLVFAINPIILAIYTKRKYHLVTHCEPDSSSLKFKKDVMAQAIASIINENIDLISVYTVYYLVFNGIKKIIQIFSGSLEAAFGNIWARNELIAMRRNFFIFEFIICFLTNVIFICTYNLLIPFIRLYTINITDFNYIYTTFGICASVATELYCFRIPYLTIVQAAGKYKETKVGAVIEAVLNIIVSLFLVVKFGLVGVTIGSIVAYLFRTVQYSIYIYDNVINEPIIVLIKRYIWAVVSGGLGIILCHYLNAYFACNTWIEWLMLGVLYTMLGTTIMTISSFLFYRDNTLDSVRLIGRMLHCKW